MAKMQLLFLVPVALLALGVAGGLKVFTVCPFELFFALAIVSSLVVMSVIIWRGFKESGKVSDPTRFVTWPMFASAFIGIHIEFFSALLWNMFYLGKIMVALGL